MANKGFIGQTWVDYDNESSTVRLNVPAITAANHDAQTALHSALRIAIATMVKGVLIKNTYGNEDRVALGPATDQDAQRELKWLVSYHDVTTLKRYSVELPCADVTQLDPNDRAHAHIGDGGEVDDFVTAFEAAVISEVGNTVVVDEITLVGRRL